MILHQKYLNIDNYSKYGNSYVVRVVIKGKTFIVWRGNDKALGIKIAKKVEKLMDVNPPTFLEWYDYHMDEELKELEREWNRIKTK